MSKNGKFLLGALIGVGAGLLLAPKKGSETREDLKRKGEELIGKAKNIDYEELSETIINEVYDLSKELKSLDKEKATKLAEKKAKEIKKEAIKLYDAAVDKCTPAAQKAAKELKTQAVKYLKELTDKLEEE